jgi:hypothetical protein
VAPTPVPEHASGDLHPHGESAESSSPGAADASIHPRSARVWSRVLAESRRRSTAWEDYWITAGLGPDDGRIAGRLRDRGFAPGDLLLWVDGLRASERLRGGEPVSLVIARLRELKRAGNADAG